MNQNYTYCFVRWAKNVFFGVLQNFSKLAYVYREMKKG